MNNLNNMNNCWHNVSRGDQFPEIVNAIVEVPQNGQVKYELDKESGMLKMDRILSSNMSYPANYGFIPQTYCDDKDPLDILVFSSQVLVPMCLMRARVLGVLEMIDQGEQDDKVIAVAHDDKVYDKVQKISDLPDIQIAQIRNFFENYKKLEKKEVVIREIYEKDKAIEIVEKSKLDYINHFKK